MKKKIIIGFIVVAIGCSFTGCGESQEYYTNEEGRKVYSTLERINDNLVYDKSTRVVYYKEWYSGNSCAYAYMSPYLSKEGAYCKYENEKVIPIEKGN